MDTGWQADSVSISQRRVIEPLLATGQRQRRPGAVEDRRARPCSEFLVPGWATAGLYGIESRHGKRHLGAASRRSQGTAFPPDPVQRNVSAVFPRRSLARLLLE